MNRLEKRSFRLAGHATSVALEPEFWAALSALAVREGRSLPDLIGSIDAQRTRNLASEIRVYILTALQGGAA